MYGKSILFSPQSGITATSLRGNLHAQMVIDAARSGVKAIFCEKPIALNPHDGHKMVRFCKKRNIPLKKTGWWLWIGVRVCLRIFWFVGQFDFLKGANDGEWRRLEQSWRARIISSVKKEIEKQSKKFGDRLICGIKELTVIIYEPHSIGSSL